MAQQRVTGIYETTAVAGEEVAAYVPHPLPPADPALELDAKLRDQLRDAEESLRRLDLAADMVPSLDWFLYGFVRKEAVLSSQIEGTQATLIDLLNYEANGTGGDTGAEDSDHADVREICNYLEALDFARDQLGRPDGLPLSMRLLNETHSRLMQGARGADKLPGEIRRSQNWIGGTRPGNAAFVPPPPHHLADLLSGLEKYLHADNDPLPPLVRTGLLHVQFETVHPYLDGNGRIGRLMIILLLEHWGLLSAPILYLSLFFKRHREEYYRRLAAVRLEGDWEGWTSYYLEAVSTVATETVSTVRDLFALTNRDRKKVLRTPGSTVIAARLFESLPEQPILTIGTAMNLLDTSRPTATKAVRALTDAGVLEERSGRERGQVFGYAGYLDLLKEETELGG